MKVQSEQEEGLTSSGKRKEEASGLGMEEGKQNRGDRKGSQDRAIYRDSVLSATEQSKPPAKKTTGQQANQQRMAEFTREKVQTRAQCRQPECSWPHDVTGRGNALTGDFLARKEER